MIFAGEPNLLVRLTRPIGKMKHFRFNAEGQFNTENERLIKRLQHKFTVLNSFQCKKCDFTTDNKGLLMAHYREHKKEESQ